MEKNMIQRELMRSGRGPGTHEIPQWPESVLESNCLCGRNDTGFGVAPRFKCSQARSTPGPGAHRRFIRIWSKSFQIDSNFLQDMSTAERFIRTDASRTTLVCPLSNSTVLPRGSKILLVLGQYRATGTTLPILSVLTKF